jgi:hypothetical protein
MDEVEALDPAAWGDAITEFLAVHGITAVLLFVVVVLAFVCIRLSRRQQ